LIADDLFHDGEIIFPSMYAQVTFLKASQSFIIIHTRTMQKYKANVPKKIVKRESAWFTIY